MAPSAIDSKNPAVATGERSGVNASVDRFGLVVFVVAVLVRAVYLVQYIRSPLIGYLRADQRYYFQWAAEIAAGNWVGDKVFEQAPLYPYLLGTGIRLGGGNMLLILIAQLLAGAVSCCLLYGAGKRLFGHRVGLVSGLILAVYGPCIFYECMILKSFLSPLLTTVALYGAVRFRDSGNIHWVWMSGMSVGLACLVRENHVLLLPPISLFLLFSSMSWRDESGKTSGKDDVVWNSDHEKYGNRVGLRTRLSAVIQLGLLAALMLVPSTARNYQVGRQFVPVTAGGGEVFYLAFGEGAHAYYSAPGFVTCNPFLEHEDFRKEAERRLGRPVTRSESSRYWSEEAFRWAVRDPQRTFDLTVQKGECLFNDYEVADGENFRVSRQFVSLLKMLPTFGWIGGLGFCGVILCCIGSRGGWIVPAMATSHAATVLLLYNFGRFRLGMMPLWILMAAVCVVWLAEGLRKSTIWQRVPRIVGLSAAVGISFVMLQPSSVGIPLGHKANDALIMADLARLGGRLDIAIKELQRVQELYRDYQRTAPNVARVLTRSHFHLGQAYESQQKFDLAAREYRQALVLPNREDFRLILLSEWSRYLRESIQNGRPIAGVESPEQELQDTLKELATLQPGGQTAVTST